MLNYIKLNLKQNKIGNIFMFLCFLLVSFVIIELVNFKVSFYNYLKYITNNYYDARKIEVLNPELSYEDMIKQVKKINFVVDAFLESEYSDFLEVDNPKEFVEDRIYIKPSGNGYIPEIIVGKTIVADDEIICPFKLAIANTNGFNTKFVNLKPYIGKKIKLNKKIYFYEKFGEEPKVIDTKNYKLKIVGLYDYSAFGDEPYYCYMKKEVIGKIILDTTPIYSDTYYPDNYEYEIGSETGIYPWLQVIVDKNSNVSYVEKELEKLNFQHSSYYHIDNDFFSTTNIVFNIGLVVFIILFGIIFFTFLAKSLKKRHNELWILKAIGYGDKKISLIILISDFIIFAISYLFAIFLSFFINKIINNYLLNNAQLIGLKISFKYIYILCIFAIFIIEFLLFYKKAKKSISMLLRRKIDGN